MDVGLAALGPRFTVNNFIDGSSQCLRITPSYHGSWSWKRPVGSSSLSPCQCSVLHYFSSEGRSSSLDISFSLDTSAKVCRFQSKKRVIYSVIFSGILGTFCQSGLYFFFSMCFKDVYLSNFACTCNAEPCIFILRKKVQVMNVSLALSQSLNFGRKLPSSELEHYKQGFQGILFLLEFSWQGQAARIGS